MVAVNDLFFRGTGFCLFFAPALLQCERVDKHGDAALVCRLASGDSRRGECLKIVLWWPHVNTEES